MDDHDPAAETDVETRERDDPAKRSQRRDADGDSIGDRVQQPIVKAWTTYLTLLFALVGAGFGLFDILRDALDESIVEPSGFGAALSIPLTATPYLGILLAALVGAFLGWRLPRDRSTTNTVAGVGMGVATAVFWLVAALFGAVPLDVSLELGGLLVNAILAGISAGLVAVGGVWLTRTRAPIDRAESRRTAR